MTLVNDGDYDESASDNEDPVVDIYAAAARHARIARTAARHASSSAMRAACARKRACAERKRAARPATAGARGKQRAQRAACAALSTPSRCVSTVISYLVRGANLVDLCRLGGVCGVWRSLVNAKRDAWRAACLAAWPSLGREGVIGQILDHRAFALDLVCHTSPSAVSRLCALAHRDAGFAHTVETAWRKGPNMRVARSSDTEPLYLLCEVSGFPLVVIPVDDPMPASRMELYLDWAEAVEHRRAGALLYDDPRGQDLAAWTNPGICIHTFYPRTQQLVELYCVHHTQVATHDGVHARAPTSEGGSTWQETHVSCLRPFDMYQDFGLTLPDDDDDAWGEACSEDSSSEEPSSDDSLNALRRNTRHRAKILGGSIQDWYRAFASGKLRKAELNFNMEATTPDFLRWIRKPIGKQAAAVRMGL